jgi:hypothetical protein
MRQWEFGVSEMADARATQSVKDAFTKGERRKWSVVGWSVRTLCMMENKYLAPWRAVAKYHSSPNRLHH